MRVLTELEARLLDYARPDAPVYNSWSEEERIVTRDLISRGLVRIVWRTLKHHDGVITDRGLLALRCHNAYKATL